MAIAKFKKLQLVAHNTLRETLLEELQQIGGVHIVDWREVKDLGEEEQAPSETPEVAKLPATSQAEAVSRADSALSMVEYCLKFLQPLQEPLGFMEKLSQSKPQITLAQLKELDTSFNLQQVYNQCQELERQTHELHQNAQQFQTQVVDFHPWAKIDLPLTELQETEATYFYALKVSQESFESFQEQLQEQLSAETELIEISREGDYHYLIILLLKEDKPLLEALLVDFETEQVDLPPLPDTPQQIIHQAHEGLTQIEKQLAQVQTQGKALLQHKESLELLYDYYHNQKKQAQVQNSLYTTSHTLVLDGWVCNNKVDKLKQRLEKKFKEIFINLREPLEGETPPIQLVNNSLVTPFESVTSLYGLPNSQELDPTPLLAPFFFIFFGLCLTDAAYGIIMMALTFWGLRKMQLVGGARKMCQLLFLAGLATLLAGAITGSWFGDLVDLLPASLAPIKEIKNSMVLFDPIKEPLTFMIISLILGYIQVWCGIAIEFYDKIKHKEWADALLVQLPWLAFLLGLGVMGVESYIGGSAIVLVRKTLVYGGAGALLILSPYKERNPIVRLLKGILELYNLVAYGSDILSYSRLLALGLATGVIGTVVNKIAFMTTGIPGIGYVFMILIMLGGHLFNLAINALGAFVHTSRLQFVEFFPKFFEGGGKAFVPFSWEGKYSIFTEKEAL